MRIIISACSPRIITTLKFNASNLIRRLPIQDMSGNSTVTESISVERNERE